MASFYTTANAANTTVASTLNYTGAITTTSNTGFYRESNPPKEKWYLRSHDHADPLDWLKERVGEMVNA